MTQIVKKETLYVGQHDLGDGEYAIEIICSTTDDLVISAQKIQGPESFIIEIEKDKVEGLLNEFEGDLNWLAQHLKLMNKRMVLINPVSALESHYLSCYFCFAEISKQLERTVTCA